MIIKSDIPKLIQLQDYPEFLQKTRHLIWVASCKDTSVLLAGIKDRLSLADDYKYDSQVFEAHLDDLRFLSENLPVEIKAELKVLVGDDDTLSKIK
jgi:hypothetical protein